jgi:hypothetical protein
MPPLAAAAAAKNRHCRRRSDTEGSDLRKQLEIFSEKQSRAMEIGVVKGQKADIIFF